MPTTPNTTNTSKSATVPRQSPVVEILSSAQKPARQAERSVGYVDDAITAVKVYAGTNAFRIYNAAAELAGTNAIGTLQGMVKSAKWRAVFRISSEASEKIEVIAFLAGLAVNITEAASEFEAVWVSKDSPVVKGGKFGRLAQRVGMRTAMGMITGGVSTIYEALEGWCMIAGLPGGKFQSASNQCVSVLREADFMVTATSKVIADLAADGTIWNVIEIVLY
jgi:hypothetical protein